MLPGIQNDVIYRVIVQSYTLIVFLCTQQNTTCWMAGVDNFSGGYIFFPLLFSDRAHNSALNR